MNKMRLAALYVAGGCLLFQVLLCTCAPVLHEKVSHHRTKRASPTIANRTACNPGDPQPAIRVNTTQRLAEMRSAMRDHNLTAFIVLSDDAHGSEYPAESDKRRSFISGFTGSAGTAVVTLELAALWTDGRYFLEAEDALDCNWIFMKSGETGVPSVTQWLIEVLKPGDVVGADPFLVPNSQWLSFQSALQPANISMKLVETDNPVDRAWHNKPEPPKKPIIPLSMDFTGRTWQEKVKDVVDEMTSTRTFGAYVVTSLDETAWLFNSRGDDIAYNPFFLSYAIIEAYSNSANNKVRLYIYDKDKHLTFDHNDHDSSHLRLYQHLNTNTTGNCSANLGITCVQVLEYNAIDVVNALEEIARASSENKIRVTFVCNYAIYHAIPEIQRIQQRSSIALTKSQKNEVERKGMENSHNRDSAVLIEFLAKIERGVKNGETNWTEVSAADLLASMRYLEQYNRGLSFGSISASGPNGAIIHYGPTNATNLPINTSMMYLLDSGGQYLDGTTDVTRTMHYGQPTAYQIECYTRVLMGAIDLALMVWPEGLYGREIDMSARAPLWEVGLEYRHGTGHGIGAYLSVHEGPGRISLTHAANPSEETLHGYMFFSDEPGYYEAGQFGIRLETIIMVEPTNTTYKFGDSQFLRFKPITLVPFEPNLIDYKLLSERQINWLNNYHKLTQETIDPLLKTQLAKDWLRARTGAYVNQVSSAQKVTHNMVAIIVLAMVVTFTLLQ